MNHQPVFQRDEYKLVIREKFTKGNYSSALPAFRDFLNLPDIDNYDRCILWMRISDCIYKLILKEGTADQSADYHEFMNAKQQYLHFLTITEKTSRIQLGENRHDAQNLLKNTLDLRLSFEPDEMIDEKIRKDVGGFIDISWFGHEHALPVLLERIFEERRNFDRKDNLKKAGIMASIYLDITDSMSEYVNSRAHIMNLLSDIAYFINKDEEGEKEALKWAERCLEIRPDDRFAKAQKKFIEERQTVQDQIRRFEHDTSSSIAGIRSTLKLLMSSLGSVSLEECASKLETVRRELDRIQAVNRFVASKKPEFRETDPAQMFDDLIKKYQEDVSVELVFSAGASGKFDTDIGYLALALDNLLRNSIEAFQRRKISRQERMIDIEVDYDKQLIRLKDNAGGIDRSIISRIFIPYVSSKPIIQKSGLGLSQAKIAIEDMLEGKLELCEDQPENGACFEIRL